MSLSQKKPLSAASTLSELIQAVMVDDVEKVQELLTRGVNPNAYEDEAQVRPLHFAAQCNALQSALLLIKAGADIKAETADGLTPWAIAKINLHEEMMLALLADVDLVKH